MASDDVFDAGQYAATPRQMALRSLQLAGRYYFGAVPRYLAARRRLGLGWWDGGALVNPLREWRRKVYLTPDPPAHYDEALDALADAGVRLTIPRVRLEALVGVWWSVRAVPGDVIECGAYRGGTALLLAVLGARHGLDQRVHVADTFTGSPAPSPFDPLREGGAYGVPPGQPERIRAQAGLLGVADRVELHAGLFADTLPRLAAADPGLALALAHVDANVYEGTRDACRFVLPRLASGAAAVFDDYNGVLDLGARLAIDECLSGHHLAVRKLAWSSVVAQTPEAKKAR